MKRLGKLFSTALVTALVAGCASAPPTDTAKQGISGAHLLGATAPRGVGTGTDAPAIPWAEMIEMAPVAPVAVNLADVIAAGNVPDEGIRQVGDRPGSPLSDEQVAALREQAMNLPEQQGFQGPGVAAPGQQAPVPGPAWDSLDYTECCGGGGNVPPDPELTVGQDYIFAVVNVAFQVYDKTGTDITPPITFASFMANDPNCAGGVFDPNAIYDEKEDRFILAIDGGGAFYCVAAQATADPLGQYWLYSFPTNVGGNFFDYPHAGVGNDAIYMGANMFGGSGFAEGRVWAFDKFAMYSGLIAGAVSWSTTGLGGASNSTPQPMNLHGWAQGTWPAPGNLHYILTDNNFDGDVYGVLSWQDPFGANVLSHVGTVDLAAATGVIAGFPVPVPQTNPPGGATLEANDWRVQDAEYRNGAVWMTSTIAVNPGGGTVDAVRWAQIDPSVPAVLNAGIIASPGEFRTFADLAVNDCNDMAVGYTKTSGAIHPSVFVTGRENFDPFGTVQPEAMVKGGELTYTAFDTPPHRWGDYSGMTIDPDGQTFWYLGEYSKDTGTTNGRWGNYIGSFAFPSCSGGPFFNKTIAFGNDEDGDTIPDRVIDVDAPFQSVYGFTINYFDPANTPAVIKDVVPEYWNPVFQIGGTSGCNVVRAPEQRNLYSDAYITCPPNPGVNSWTFFAGTRFIPNSGGQFEPTECGAFYLNEGAGAFTGRALYQGPTDPICLAAVKDLNGNGLDYTGNGDEDNDGVTDYQEACIDGTDPCAGVALPPCGDCLIANGTPGCENAACEATVCALDPFCCDVEWDGICAGEAATNCVGLCAFGPEDTFTPDPDYRRPSGR